MVRMSVYRYPGVYRQQGIYRSLGGADLAPAMDRADRAMPSIDMAITPIASADAVDILGPTVTFIDREEASASIAPAAAAPTASLQPRTAATATAVASGIADMDFSARMVAETSDADQDIASAEPGTAARPTMTGG